MNKNNFIQNRKLNINKIKYVKLIYYKKDEVDWEVRYSTLEIVKIKNDKYEKRRRGEYYGKKYNFKPLEIMKNKYSKIKKEFLDKNKNLVAK